MRLALMVLMFVMVVAMALVVCCCWWWWTRLAAEPLHERQSRDISGKAAACVYCVADFATAQRRARYTVHGFIPPPYRMRKYWKGYAGIEREIAVCLSHPMPS